MTAAPAMTGLPTVDGSDQRRLAQRLALLDDKVKELRAEGVEMVVREDRDGVFRIVPRQRART